MIDPPPPQRKEAEPSHAKPRLADRLTPINKSSSQPDRRAIHTHPPTLAGGAAATLCAADMGMRFGLGRHTLLYTFGEPRVGDVVFAQAVPIFTVGAFRVVHRSDCVPHLPPCCDGLLEGPFGWDGGRWRTGLTVLSYTPTGALSRFPSARRVLTAITHT